MNQTLFTAARLSLAALGSTVLLVASSTSSVMTQGISSRSAVSPPDVEQALTTLRQQVSALERRVADLEKKPIAIGTQEGGGASDKKLEQRLASLEKAQEASNTDARGGSKSAAQTVRAPFVVVDDGGKTLFRVDVAPGSTRARASVGDPTGTHVHLGPNAAGGSTVAVMSNATDGDAVIFGSPKSSYINVRNGQRSASLSVDAVNGTIQILNGSAVPVVTLKSTKNEVGYLELADQSGEIRVQGGTNASQVGMVMTSGPGGGGLTLMPGKPLSMIVGWKK